MNKKLTITTSTHGYKEGDAIYITEPRRSRFMLILAWLRIIPKHKTTAHTICKVNRTNVEILCNE